MNFGLKSSNKLMAIEDWHEVVAILPLCRRGICFKRVIELPIFHEECAFANDVIKWIDEVHLLRGDRVIAQEEVDILSSNILGFFYGVNLDLG